MTRVLIVDDHPIVVQGCRRALEDIGVETIAHAPTVRRGYRAYLRDRPNVVITDLSFEGDDLAGLELVRRINTKHPSALILVFSMHDDPAIVSRALSCGAAAYVLKDAPSSELTQALESICAGQPYLSHALAMKVAMSSAKNKRLTIAGLTERELQILALLGRGYGNDKIAARLGISGKTVGNATALLRAKLELGSLAELIRFAMQSKNDLLV